jgi:hypothetical protein
MAMGKATLKKEKWTLSFDSRLKSIVVKAAHRKGVYPVNLLEEIVRERFNPYGLTHVKDSAEYVATMRQASREPASWPKLGHGNNLGPCRHGYFHRLFQLRQIQRHLRLLTLHGLLFCRYEKGAAIKAGSPRGGTTSHPCRTWAIPGSLG